MQEGAYLVIIKAKGQSTTRKIVIEK
ncbi:hypothetical protein [Chryseobacterium sp. B21-037]